MLKKLREKDARELIISILSKAVSPLTTQVIEEIVQGEGKQCPDSAVRFLAKMRYKGLIKGKLSKKHRGWIWWVEKKGD
jgi:hypothetical protein